MEITFNSVGLWNLFRASGEKKKDFGNYVFGKTCRMGPEYFDNAKFINFDHLARLCEHYGKEPSFFIDYHDDDTHDNFNQVGGVVYKSQVEGNVNITNEDITTKESLMLTIKNQESVITDKNRQIDWLKAQLEKMTEIVGKSGVK